VSRHALPAWCAGPPVLAHQIDVVSAGLACILAILIACSLVTLARCAQVLIGRVINTAHNWETETLRSFIELTTWLSGIWLAFDITNSWWIALLCGSLSGWVLVLGGEALTPLLRTVESRIRAAYDIASPNEKSPHRLRVGVGIGPDAHAALIDPVIFAIYGIGGLRLIYQNVSDIVLAGVLAGLAGCALLALSKLIAAWPPTRRAGQILQDRILNTTANWRAFPARSAIEACSFLGCTIGAHARYHDRVFAVQAGLGAGMLVCLLSEMLGGRWMVPTQHEDTAARLVPFCICAYVVLLSCYWTFAPSGEGRFQAFSLQLLFAICCGASAELASRCFLAHGRTRALGALIQQRLTHTVTNWETRPLRSAIEVGLTNIFTVAVWHTSRNVHLTFVVGVVSGMGIVVLSDKYIFRSTEEETAAAIAKLANSAAPLMTSAVTRVGTKAAHPVMDDRTAALVARVVSHTELWAHRTSGDCWLAIHGRVYDVSRWHVFHPGGEEILLAYAGRDASDQFELFHPPMVGAKLRPFLIGSLESTPPPRMPVRWGLTSNPEADPTRPPADPSDAPSKNAAVDLTTRDYRELRRELWAEGAFEPEPIFYMLKQLVVFAFFGAALLALRPSVCSTLLSVVARFIGLERVLDLAANSHTAGPLATWQILLSAALLALSLQQAAFIGHDTLHNGVFCRPRGQGLSRSLLAQLNAGLLLGISCEMWLCEHNLHHAYTLRPGEDPQFRYFPLWLQSVKEIPLWLAELPSARTRPILRAFVWRCVQLLTRVQHITIAPMAMLIGRYNFLLISWVFAFSRRKWLDVSFMAAHLCWFAIWLAVLLPSTRERLLFVAVHYACVGVLHVQLLLSHLCTQQFSADEEATLGVFRFQLATTRNIATNAWDSWFHGGLEKQIEHHLFPQLPRHRLHAVAPRVKALATKHGVPYMEEDFSAAMLLCAHNLARLSIELATVNPAA